MNERIVISGIGLISPLGNNLKDFRGSLLDGRSGTSLFHVPPSWNFPAGVCAFDENKYLSAKEVKRKTRSAGMSIYCAREALDDARIDLQKTAKDRMGVFIGVADFATSDIEGALKIFQENGRDITYWPHNSLCSISSNNSAGEVSIHLAASGPHFCVGAACAASIYAIISGIQMIASGEIDTAVVGGVSQTIRSLSGFANFFALGALAKHDDPAKACRPFDKGRNGVVVSEGCCLFVIEKHSAAMARHANVYAEIAGYAMNSSTNDPIMPDATKEADCMRMALKHAALTPRDISLINAHATGTVAGDLEEIRAIREIFGPTSDVFVNSTKGFIGHTMGAAGALELAANIPSFTDHWVHPSLNIDTLDDACVLPGIVYDRPLLQKNVTYILKNSFGILGVNSSIIIKNPCDR